MKRYILALLWIVFFSCKTSQKISQENISDDFEIVETPIIVRNDTVVLNEMRFYNIRSAMDGMLLMYQNYGQWTKKIEGKYQQNINRIIWENIKLMNNDELFTIIADGTETKDNYFASIMVFDSNGSDCLIGTHPYKEILTNLFVNKMRKIKNNPSAYQFFR